MQNGIKQIPLPNQTVNTNSIEKPESQNQQSNPSAVEETTKQKVAKPKKEKPSKPPQNPTELPIDIGRLDLRIAKIEDVQRHPDADSLYVLKIK